MALKKKSDKMIGLTFITQFVYWYRGLKTPRTPEFQRTELIEMENQLNEPTSQNISVDYITPYDQPWTDGENNYGHPRSRIIPELPEWNCYDGGLIISNSSEKSSKPYQSEQFKQSSTDEDLQRKMSWENNEMEYMGRDSFENVLARLERSLAE